MGENIGEGGNSCPGRRTVLGSAMGQCTAAPQLIEGKDARFGPITALAPRHK